MAGELGKNMTFLQFLDVVELVMNEHKWPMQGHGIKYIRTSFDTRTGDFFGITFEGIRGLKALVVINENRQRDLNQWVLEFLNSPPEEQIWENYPVS